MQITIISLGSRGDVQPYVALGKGLLKAGHGVRLLTHTNYEDLVRAHGLDFYPARGNVQAVMETEEMRALLAQGNFLAITRRTSQEARRAALDWARDGLVACTGSDLIIAGLGGLFTALALAEKLDRPFLQAYLVPFTPTSAFATPVLPPGTPNPSGILNRVSHQMIRQVMWQSSRAADKAARQQVLGLPANGILGPFGKARFQAQPVLYGFSPAVLAKPPDWGPCVHVTGYWFLDAAAAWTPPADLVAFLDADPPPVYVGFGSMVNREPEATTKLVLEALREAEVRAVLVSGWGGLSPGDLPDTVYMLEVIPHAWLFPRVTAVVHHGGAGTTAAGLRAGVPSLIVPFFGDQFFWGARVAALGVGPAPIPRKELTAARLAQALVELVRNEAFQQRATALGATIRGEDGIAGAVEVVATVEEREAGGGKQPGD